MIITLGGTETSLSRVSAVTQFFRPQVPCEMSSRHQHGGTMVDPGAMPKE